MTKPIDFTAAAVARAKDRIRRGEAVHTRPGTPLDGALHADPEMIVIDEAWVRGTLARMSIEARTRVVGAAIRLAQMIGDEPSETALLYHLENMMRALDICGELQKWLAGEEAK